MNYNSKWFLSKHLKLFICALTIVTTVTVTMSNKIKGEGNLYCTDRGNVCDNKVDFIEYYIGDGSEPCGRTNGIMNPVFKQIVDNCILASGPFIWVPAGR